MSANRSPRQGAVATRRARRLRHPGQAVPILALTLLLLIGFSGLAIDGALAFAWRRNVSNSADAAALFATRALIEERGSVSGAELHEAVQDYLESELDVTDPEFELFYVDRNGNRLPSGSPQPIPDNGGLAPSDARGVAVDVHYTFATYLMRVFGQATLTVGGSATVRFGNAGTISGAYVAPLALLSEAASFIRNHPDDALLDISGAIEAENAALMAAWLANPANDPAATPPGYVDPSDFAPRWQVRSIALRMDPATPSMGGGAGCPGSPVDTLKSWWCHGTEHSIKTRNSLWGDQTTLARDLVGVTEFDASLVSDGFVGRREGDVIIVPVLAEAVDWSGSTPNPAYVVEYFMALRLTSVESDGAIRVEYLPRFLTNGGLMPLNNNVERGDPCEVCVVNLVRPRG